MGSRHPSALGRAHPYDVLLGPWSVGVAAVVVLGATAGGWLFDPGRIELELCWMRSLWGLPCPGCGLTRSVLHLARGDLGRGLWFHPFGLPLLVFSVLALSSLLWRRAVGTRLHRVIDRHRTGVERTYGAIVFFFLAFGLLRGLAAATGLWPLWQ